MAKYKFLNNVSNFDGVVAKGEQTTIYKGRVLELEENANTERLLKYKAIEKADEDDEDAETDHTEGKRLDELTPPENVAPASTNVEVPDVNEEDLNYSEGALKRKNKAQLLAIMADLDPDHEFTNDTENKDIREAILKAQDEE